MLPVFPWRLTEPWQFSFLSVRSNRGVGLCPQGITGPGGAESFIFSSATRYWGKQTLLFLFLTLFLVICTRKAAKLAYFLGENEKKAALRQK
jgi:hypothetical protein